MIANLVDRYHAEPDSFTEEQAEKLALIAFETNTPFRPQTKKLKKFFFDLADTALLGLIPNERRPKRVGEDLYGETRGEDIAGAAGSLLGLATGATGAVKLGKAALPKAALFAHLQATQRQLQIAYCSLLAGNSDLQTRCARAHYRVLCISWIR